ncbi:MAG: ATP synthase F1 subunit gamma [Proteobacteria bacterium]|nr:ATP synthase F1 subunit gamma [Pseudomonadota bacterium]
MAQLREIKKRIVAVKTIQRITKTMQMIATAKFTAALARAKNSRPYTDTIRGLVAKVSSQAGDTSHPLLEKPARASGKELVLVIASDRGLCGAYNSNVLRTATKLLAEIRAGGSEVVLDASGRKALGFFKYQKQEVSNRHAVGDRPQYDAVEKIGQDYIDRYVAGEFSSVKVVYMRFISAARQRPEVMQLLPLSLPKAPEGAEAAGANANFDFSPSAPELLDELLPRSVKVSLYQAFLDAVVSENVMRMVAMKAATDNAGGLGRTLKRSFNRARQARITTELTEIVAGVEALK